MDFRVTLDAFFSSQAGQLALWVVLLPVVDFVLSVSAAIRDGTFTLDSVAAFLRKHVAGRIVPIWILLFVGHFADQWLVPVVDVPALTAVGVAAAGLYVAETIGSILRAWGPQTGPALMTRDPSQPVPKD
jgi:hypothetical protein